MGIMLRSAAALLAMLASPVAANVKIATFTSTLVDGYDRTGLFGAPGTSLAGKEFTTVYRYDLALGDHYPVAGQSELLQGRWQCNPILDVAVIVDGIARHVPQVDYFDPEDRGCDTYDHYYFDESLGAVEVGLTDYFSIFRYSQYPSAQIIIYNNVALKPSPTRLDFTSPVRRYANFGGGFSLNFSGQPQPDANGRSTGIGKFSVRDETVDVRGVPEPASWTLMLAGFAMTGSALRRRQAICPCAP